MDEPWDDMMKMFKETRGAEPLKPTSWNKIISRLKQIKDSETFEMMVKLMLKDPLFEMTIDTKKEMIADQYIEKIRRSRSLPSENSNPK